MFLYILFSDNVLIKRFNICYHIYAIYLVFTTRSPMYQFCKYHTKNFPHMQIMTCELKSCICLWMKTLWHNLPQWHHPSAAGSGLLNDTNIATGGYTKLFWEFNAFFNPFSMGTNLKVVACSSMQCESLFCYFLNQCFIRRVVL